jgi:hypothetical protein
MSILTRKTNPALGSILASKATSLREAQTREAEASRSFILRAQEASAASDTAAKHADATEKALTILEEAGVPLN